MRSTRCSLFPCRCADGSPLGLGLPGPVAVALSRVRVVRSYRFVGEVAPHAQRQRARRRRVWSGSGQRSHCHSEVKHCGLRVHCGPL